MDYNDPKIIEKVNKEMSKSQGAFLPIEEGEVINGVVLYKDGSGKVRHRPVEKDN